MLGREASELAFKTFEVFQSKLQMLKFRLDRNQDSRPLQVVGLIRTSPKWLERYPAVLTSSKFPDSGTRDRVNRKLSKIFSYFS